jgi:hypothetical protein
MYSVSDLGCWDYAGRINEKGYGVIKVSGKPIKAHVYFWRYLEGPIPVGMELDHLCRNRGCVNPRHLELVSHTQNCRRGYSTKFTDEQVLEIRRRAATIQRIAGRSPKYDGRETMKGLARELGISRSQLGRIADGESRR